MTTARTLRAVAYRRVSSFDQLGGTSPETQLARAEALIRQERWEHVGDFYDGGVSGAKASRPDLDRLFEMCRAGLVDVVVVGDLSRLSRDLRNSLNFEHELRQLGVQLIDADNPNADELARMFSYLQNHRMRDAEAKRKRTNLALAAASTGPEAVADALAEVNRDVAALEQMREQARAWAQANAERSVLLRDLWKLAKVARERLDNPTPERMRDVFAALDIRVQITAEGVLRRRRRTPPDLRITGVVPIGDFDEGASSTGR